MAPLLHNRLSLAATLAVAAFVLVSCGDDGSGDQASGGSPEAQVRSTVEGLYDALGDYDAAAVCERMTPTAQQQLARGGAPGAGGSSDATCEESFGTFLDLAKEGGGLRRTLMAKVRKVEVDGDEALVTVAFGAQKGQMPLEKIDGEWRIGILAAPSPEPAGGG